MSVTDKAVLLKPFSRVLRLMGNRFEITVVAPGEQEKWANDCIHSAIAEMQRIEKSLSTYIETSQTNQINQNAGIAPVKVDPEIVELINRAAKISTITQGAFDISYGSVDKRLWNFDKTMDSLPDEKTAKRMVRFIDYKKIILDSSNSTIFLKEKGMRIGFGGIGKGYAADRAKFILQQHGVENGVVNAAGDLTAWGCQANGKPWTIGIANPDMKQHPFAYFEMAGRAVATSGNYEKYVVINGKKYSHTINPKTGMPITGIKSVTVIGPCAEIADALTTPVMIMGVNVGLDMINQMKSVACIIIDDDNKIYTSKNISLK